MDTEALPYPPLRLLDSLGSARAPLVVDVRRRQAFDADPRLIAGATWRDPFDLDAWVRYLPRHRAVVVYCVHGHEISRNAGAALRAAGIAAHVLEGGLEAWLAEDGPTVTARSDPAIPSSPSTPSTWVTRERPKIDRIACPWLVRRFIDPLARFEYVPEPESAGLLAMSMGLGRLIPGDNELLERGMLLYDALYASCRGAVAGERDVHTWNYPS